MNPPDHNPQNLPQQGHGEAAGRRPVTGSNGAAPKPEVGTNRIEKPKAQTQGDRIFEILYAKTIAAARKLGYLNLPESSLEKAARTLAVKRTQKRLQEAFRYAENSAKSEIIKDADILTEVLPEFGITTMKLCPKASERKASKVRKKGGNHGA